MDLYDSNISQKKEGGRQMAIFKGTGVAIVTPMHEDGKVNFEKRGLIHFRLIYPVH